MSTLTPTPRTDEAAHKAGEDHFETEVVKSDFARQLERELAELQAWKDSMLAVESEWDVQALAKLLGAKLGESCRKVISQRVPELLAELAEAKSYKDAIDLKLVCAHLGVANGKPKEELQALIEWEIGVHEFFEVDRLKQKLAASQSRETQLRLAATYAITHHNEDGDTSLEQSERAISFNNPPPGIPLAEVKALVSLLQTIHDDADGYADGAPDASSHDKLCAQLVDLTRPLLRIIKSKHPELI